MTMHIFWLSLESISKVLNIFYRKSNYLAVIKTWKLIEKMHCWLKKNITVKCRYPDKSGFGTAFLAQYLDDQYLLSRNLFS
jgi:hypothetical protein